MTNEQLIKIAQDALWPNSLSNQTEVGTVSCALITDKGNVYTGINIDTSSSLGYCAEANAIGTMITNKESRIIKIVAVSSKRGILPPCGRCREFMYQVNNENLDATIILKDRTAKLNELLPDIWNIDKVM